MGNFAMPAAASPLSARQTTVLAAMGAFYWFVAALIVRWTAAGWVGNDALTALVFALIVAGTAPALLLGMEIARVEREAAQRAAAIMTGIALLLDGIALTWLPALYGTDPATVLGGAAAIMWGAGVAIALGFVLQRR